MFGTAPASAPSDQLRLSPRPARLLAVALAQRQSAQTCCSPTTAHRSLSRPRRPTADHYLATSTTNASVFNYASTTAISATNINVTAVYGTATSTFAALGLNGTSTPTDALTLAATSSALVAETPIATSTSQDIDWRQGNQQLMSIAPLASPSPFRITSRAQRYACATRAAVREAPSRGPPQACCNGLRPQNPPRPQPPINATCNPVM